MLQHSKRWYYALMQGAGAAHKDIVLLHGDAWCNALRHGTTHGTILAKT